MVSVCVVRGTLCAFCGQSVIFTCPVLGPVGRPRLRAALLQSLLSLSVAGRYVVSGQLRAAAELAGAHPDSLSRRLATDRHQDGQLALLGRPRIGQGQHVRRIVCRNGTAAKRALPASNLNPLVATHRARVPSMKLRPRDRP